MEGIAQADIIYAHNELPRWYKNHCHPVNLPLSGIAQLRHGFKWTIKSTLMENNSKEDK
jgi:hypothetical protein